MESFKEDHLKRIEVHHVNFHSTPPANFFSNLRRKLNPMKFLSCFFLGTVLAGLVIGLLILNNRLPRHGAGATTPVSAAPEPTQRNCEGGPEKATAAGCVFDVMTARLTPPECFNAELSKNASASIKHPIFYQWPNFTEPLSETEDPWVLRNYDKGWTYTDYHVVHCRYVLQLAAEAAGRWAMGEHDFLLNSLSADVYHTNHCMWVLENHEENKLRPSASHDPAKTGVTCISIKG
ncbi:hypothetical protein CPLU01_07925 [Colletotrichum plurivorum]|uniref:Uncharacterized protein n=1 Tax=Colletotrichum plurivorum TaxID=2175906 RepID=A0A8H6NDP5_9PEZI|nr:hypothetical protein CPLU01_07925 [Colletotrichum plurivorum]